MLVFSLASRSARTFDSLLGGIAVGLIVVGGWYVTGHVGYVAEHPETLQEAFIATNSNRPESLSLVAPFAYTLELLMFWSDKSKHVTFGIATALGIVAGSLAYALLSRTYREESFPNAQDLKRHILGAILMGFGGITALGCTIGQGLSGVSTLAIGSFDDRLDRRRVGRDDEVRLLAADAQRVTRPAAGGRRSAVGCPPRSAGGSASISRCIAGCNP